MARRPGPQDIARERREEPRALSLTGYFREILLVVAIYLIMGLLGLVFSLPPSPATPIWPPAGIALAAILLCGTRIWPAIATGALILAITGAWNQDDGLTEALPMIIACTVAAPLQALLGRFLLRRFGKYPNDLDSPRHVIAFLGLAGAAAVLLGATLKAAALMMITGKDLSNLALDWTIWWTGDELGIVIFAPLALAWWPAINARWASRRVAITLSLGIVLCSNLVLVGYTAYHQRKIYQQGLDDLAGTMSAELEKSLTIYVDAVASIEGLSSSLVDLDGETFRQFSAHLSARLPNIRALVWVSRIAEEDRDRFEGRTGLKIKERNGNQWVTAKSRADYFVVTFAEPVLRNKEALGFNIASDPMRLDYLEKARDSGQLVLSQQLPLVTGSQGVLAFLPVYRRDSPLDNETARRQALRGVVFGVFRPTDVVENAFGKTNIQKTDYWLIDTTTSPDILAANTAAKPAIFHLNSPSPFGAETALGARHHLNAGGRRWTLQVTATPNFLLLFQQEFVWLVLLGGLAVNSLTCAGVLVVTGREMTLRRTADERAAALSKVEMLNEHVREEAEARFNVIMGNVGEAILILDDQGRIEAFNRAAEQIFACCAEDVLGQAVTTLIPKGDAPRHAENLPKILRRQSASLAGRTIEVTGRRMNGEHFAAELSLGEAGGNDRQRFIAIIRDISQRKEVERELRESERRFRDIAGSASDWFWETDKDYRLTFVSERIGSILGVKAQAILGLTHFDLGLAELPELAAQHDADIAAKRPFRDLTFHVGPSGNAKDSKSIRLSGSPVFGADEAFIGYRGIGADITRELDAERRARQAVQQMADAIESIPDAIAVFDAADDLVICNAEYRKVFGTAASDLRTGLSFEAILTACDEHKLFDTSHVPFSEWKDQRRMLHQLASGEPYLLRLADGRWIQSREYRTADGGRIGVRSDITELKHREEELENLRRRYALILDSAGEGIIGLDRHGQVTFANRTAGSLLGYPPDDMIGRSFDALVLPEVAADDHCPLTTTSLTTACREGTTRQVGNDLFYTQAGQSLPVDYLVAPIFEGSLSVGAVMVFRDASLRIQYERGLADHQKELERQVAERTAELTREVSIRTQVEAALRASRERHKRVTDSLFEGVLAVDRAGHIVFANPSARRLLHCDVIEGDIEGYPLDDIFHLRQNGTDIAFLESPWQRVISENTAIYEDDAVFVTASHHTLSVAYACSPLPYEDGRHAAIISFRDIETLKQAQREAIQASRLASVGQLAAGIAHEINTPVQYIGDNLRYIGKTTGKLVQIAEAAADLSGDDLQNQTVAKVAAALDGTKISVMAGDLDDAVRESLDGVAQIARIVLSMKEFSHPGTSTKTTTNINRALESTLTVTRNEWKHSAEIVRDLDPDLPSILCHAGEINQVFLNLIVNATHAIDASGKAKPGRITISTRRAADKVVIRITDSGTGVPDAIREKIFDPFFTTKEVGKGTGQGLAICRDVVVTKHNGSIDVVSTPGEGAEFIVTLPIELNETSPEEELE